MPTLEVLKGLPGSGKSTYARAKVHADPVHWVRVNKDDLRAMLHDSVWKGSKTEEQVVHARDLLVEEHLSAGRNVIVDDTNLAPEHVARLSTIAKGVGANFVVNDSFLAVPVKQCIKNDLKRPNSVGHKVINKMYTKYLLPAWQPPAYNPGLGHCIIVDIDGTLAHMAGRSPYDYSAVHTDQVDPVVRMLVYDAMAREDVIVVMSGRDEECRDATEEWLDGWHVPFHELHMREHGDNRDDAIVKRELYEAHVLDKYNVRYVLDDRDRVVDMWRASGLKCLQVAEGDF